MTKRVYNFSAGPAVLPLPALEEAQRDLLALPEVGVSVLELSHRAKPFTAIVEGAEANLRKLLNIPQNYSVLFLQGGAQLQFGMVPMNFLRNTGKSADYVLTGNWGKKAISEAKTQGPARAAFDAAESNYNHVPTAEELDLDSGAAYVHITSNETIQGVQFPTEPEVGDVPLVCDSSSDMLCRPVPIDRYGLIYACAQKNLAPAGVTVVIIRDDLLAACPDDLPSMLNYSKIAKADSLLNTPCCFGIYMIKLVTEWLLREIGDLAAMEARNREKSQWLYEVIDGSGGFYIGHAKTENRSIMNVPFRMADESLTEPFLQAAEEIGLTFLKGHRSVGGCRASIYNAMPPEGVRTLAQFMGDFQQKNG